jgi:hypothetical protein
LTPISPTNDWVTARSACSIDHAFEALKLAVEADLNVRNKQLPAGLTPFEITAQSDCFVIFRKTSRHHAIIRFEQGEASILVFDVKNDDRTLKAEATLIMNDLGECRLKCDGRELEFWQFRRKILEDFFFILKS